MASQKKMKLLKLIGGNFNDSAADVVRCGKLSRGTGDSWNMQKKKQ